MRTSVEHKRRVPDAGRESRSSGELRRPVVNASTIPMYLRTATSGSRRHEHEADRIAETLSQPVMGGRDVAEGAIDRRDGPQPLPLWARAAFEPAFGFDFGGVVVRADAATPLAAGGARAVTAGCEIYLGDLDAAPRAQSRLLAHELAHVVQQGAAPPLAGSYPRPVSPIADAPALQFDLAVEPPRPAAVAVPLTPQQVQAAIRFNQVRMSDPYIFAVIRDVIGVDRFPAVVDEPFVRAIAQWQTEFNLPADGRLTTETVGTIVTELRAEAAVVPALAADADLVELEAARTFNVQLSVDARTVRIIQRIVGAPRTGAWDDPTLRAIMVWQPRQGLVGDGMVGPATLRALVLDLVAARSFNDAIHVIVDAHHFPTANVNTVRFDSTFTAADAINDGAIAAGAAQGVRVGPSAFTQPYEHLVRIIGHEFQHAQMSSQAVPIANISVQEFLAFSWEALSTDAPALTAADRVAHARLAITHWNASPAADRAPHQAVRDRLDRLIAAGGVGNF